ncbi:MAG TPA: hypothetical protein VF320_05610, partial [Acidimicrobiales bacterium]
MTEGPGPAGDAGAAPRPPADAGGAGGGRDGEPDLDLILEEVESVVDPIAESAALGPAIGIAVAGGPLVPLPPDEAAPGLIGSDNSVKAGLLQAGPVAIAGLVVNGAAALVVIAVARLVSSRSYG